MNTWKVLLTQPRRLADVVEAYGGPSSFATHLRGGNPRMVRFWLAGKKLPAPKRAARINELARAKAFPAVFKVLNEAPPPVKRGDRKHHSWVFRNREFGILVRAFGDIFLFADAAGVTRTTAYRWAARTNEPRSYHALRVNELARERQLALPFVIHNESRFRGRGRLAALVRAYGGVALFSRAAGASETAVRTWVREGDVRPLAGVRERVNAMARESELAEPFARERPVRFRGRGPLPALVRALGGVAGLARAAEVGETSVRRWLEGISPWQDVASRVNGLAQARELAAPFDLHACQQRPRSE